MKNTASKPKPRVVSKVVKNTIPRVAAPPVRTVSAERVVVPTRSCNCGGSGLK